MPLSHASPPSRKRRRRRLPGGRDSDDEGDTIGQDDDDDWLAIQDALLLVRNPNEKTQAPLEVEKLVWQRISGYVHIYYH